MKIKVFCINLPHPFYIAQEKVVGDWHRYFTGLPTQEISRLKACRYTSSALIDFDWHLPRPQNHSCQSSWSTHEQRQRKWLIPESVHDLPIMVFVVHNLAHDVQQVWQLQDSGGVWIDLDRQILYKYWRLFQPSLVLRLQWLNILQTLFCTKKKYW